MTGPLILSIFPGVDLLGRAFAEEWTGACIVRGPDLLWGGDIRSFHPPAGCWGGIIGGPPCPDFSPLRYLIAAHGYQSRHGNLIPEFERCVSEAQPDWFLMEEGPLAPDAVVPGYAQHGFFLCPTWLGEAQSRKRKFCFGVKGDRLIKLEDWIDNLAVFGPLVAESTVCQAPPPGTRDKIRQGAVYSNLVDNSDDAKGRVKQPAVTHYADPYPVQRGGSGKVKAPSRSWEESCRLQGVEPTFLADAPFTLTGKREVLGNGVAMPVGRAIARAIRSALGWPE